VFRSVPAAQATRKVISEDKIHLVHSFYTCPVSLTMGLPKWFYDKAKSGGALIDQATHNLDFLRYLFGEVSEARGTARNPVHKKKPGYTIDETLGLILTFRSGIVAAHTHTWVGDTWRNEMTFSGEKNFYRLNLNSGFMACEKPVKVTGKLAGGKVKKPVPGTASFQFQQDSRSIYDYQNELFLKQVATGNWKSNPSDYSDGLKTLELTHVCDRALAGGVVKVK